MENFAGWNRGTHPELLGDGGGERGFALGDRAAAAVNERVGVGFDAADGRAVAGAHGSLLGERRRVAELAHAAAAGFELEVAEAVLRSRVLRGAARGAAEHPARGVDAAHAAVHRLRHLEVVGTHRAHSGHSAHSAHRAHALRGDEPVHRPRAALRHPAHPADVRNAHLTAGAHQHRVHARAGSADDEIVEFLQVRLRPGGDSLRRGDERFPRQRLAAHDLHAKVRHVVLDHPVARHHRVERDVELVQLVEQVLILALELVNLQLQLAQVSLLATPRTTRGLAVGQHAPDSAVGERRCGARNGQSRNGQSMRQTRPRVGGRRCDNSSRRC